MKNSKFIKILSLLLCSLVFLASCGEEPTEPDAPVQEQPVAPEFKSYFDTSFESKVESLTEAVRFDGEIVGRLERDDVSLLLIKESRIDELNRVCETFRVYNVEMGEIIAPVTNVYDRVGLIPENAVSSDADKQISTVEIKFLEFSELPLVEVKTTVLEKITDEAKKEDENVVGDYVTVSESFVYYDVYGNEITECLSSAEASTQEFDKYNNDLRLEIGRVVAVFDGSSYKLLATFDSESDIIYSGYDYANEEYYYYGSESRLIKVYDKANKLVYSKQVEPDFSYFVMNNGSILLQEFVPVLSEEETGDLISGGNYYNMNTTLINVTSGEEKKIETDLVVYDVYTAADLVRYDLPTTANTKNLIVANYIEREHLHSTELKLVVCDNDFNVLFETKEAYPIQTTPIGFESLSGGYFALDLEGVADRVIISPEGETVAFVREGLEIKEGFVISDKAIYDYSLKTLYNFEEHNVELVATVGNSVIVVNKPAEAKPGATAPAYIRAYKRLNVMDDGMVIETNVFAKEFAFEGVFGNVIVMKNENSGKYTVYNYRCEHILTTDSTLHVIENNGEIAVIANNGGVMRAYKLD